MVTPFSIASAACFPYGQEDKSSTRDVGQKMYSVVQGNGRNASTISKPESITLNRFVAEVTEQTLL